MVSGQLNREYLPGNNGGYPDPEKSIEENHLPYKQLLL